jgi:hypothetical protein
LLDRSHLVAAFRLRFGSRGPNEAQAAFAQGLALGPNALPAQRIIDAGEFVRNHVTASLSNWKKLIELSGAYGYKTICVLQPTAALDREFAVALTMKQYGLEQQTGEQWQEALSVLYAEASRQIGEMRQGGTETVFLDWKDALQPADPYFWDLVHVYDEINAQLAGRLFEETRPLMEGALVRTSQKRNP